MYYSLTHPQKRIWYTDLINEGSNIHNLGGCLHIKGEIDVSILEKVVNKIIENNEALRTRIKVQDGQPVQEFISFKYEKIESKDFSKEEEPHRECHKWAESVFAIPFTIVESKLYQFVIFKVSEEEYGLFLKIHHIIADGWSINLIQKEIVRLYDLIREDESHKESEGIYCYKDFIQKEKDYLRSPRFQKNKTYWGEKFSGISYEEFYRSSRTVEGSRFKYNLSRDKTGSIREFVQEEKISLNTLFISAMAIFMKRTEDKEKIIIGTPVLNRSGKKEKSTIGMFVSTMPFMIEIRGEDRITEVLANINRELRGGMFNQKYPYDLLVNDLQISSKGYDSLFRVSVNFYNTKVNRKIDSKPIELEELYCGNQSYSLQLIIKEWDEGEISLYVDYKEEEYTFEYIESMCKSLLHICEEIVRSGEEDKCIRDIGLVDHLEEEKLLYEFNSKEEKYPIYSDVYSLICKQSMRVPDKDALLLGEKRMKYSELYQYSKELGCKLREMGVGSETVVGVMGEHSMELILAIISILKAGGAFLPIAKDTPVERVKFMLEDSGAEFLIKTGEIPAEQEEGLKTIRVESIQEIPLPQNHMGIEESFRKPESLAYIIYTSGSTGKPKGVCIEDRSLINYGYWAGKSYFKSEDEIFAFYSSIAFDLTITSIFAPLISGRTVDIYPDRGEGFVLWDVIEKNRTTVIKLTPSHLLGLMNLENVKSSVNTLILGGENFKTGLAEEVQRKFGEDTRIFNEYGPTEATVGCMIHKFNKDRDRGVSVPIGVPADNQQIYILDKFLKPVPIGVGGEIFISGDGIARGYLNRDRLNGERFINNPFVKGKRMYRTGDLGKFISGDIIEYAGRCDEQIKIRGHRIEAGEIEWTIMKEDRVKQCTVRPMKIENESMKLWAYMVLKKDENIDEIGFKEAIRVRLEGSLPKYMIPDDFIIVECIPLTQNGKVDFKALPIPKREQHEMVMGKGAVESAVQKIIGDVLGTENISMRDNFYGLGGDSIKAIQVVGKLKTEGYSLRMRDLLESETVADIAACTEIIEGKNAPEQGIVEGEIRKTPVIQWFIDEKFPERHYYNQSVLLKLHRRTEVVNIKKALDSIIEHHDMLRGNFKDGKLYINNSHLHRGVEVYEYKLSNEEESEKSLIEIGEKLKGSFRLENSLLVKAAVIEIENGEQMILITAHHLLVDGVSWRIILENFVNLMGDFESGKHPEKKVKSHSFKRWSEELYDYSQNMGDQFEKQYSYWRETLAVESFLEKSFHGAQGEIEKKTFVIDEDVVESFQEKGREIYGANLNEMILFLLAQTLRETTGKREFLFELEGHGREDIYKNLDIENTVGWFTTMFPLKIEMEDGEDNIDRNIKALKEKTRGVPNKGFDFGILRYMKGIREFQEYDAVRFNFLGDFTNILPKERYEVLFGLGGSDISKKNLRRSIIDISAFLMKGKIFMEFFFNGNYFTQETGDDFIEKLELQCNKVRDYIEGLNEKQFTPSDFQDSEISLEDLDLLF